MVTGPFIVGKAEAGEMVATPLVGMLKLMVSAKSSVRWLASWMAALSVHWLSDAVGFTSQTASERFASGVSAVRLTVKIVAACAAELAASIRYAAIPAATTIKHAPRSAFLGRSVLAVRFATIAWVISLSSLFVRREAPGRVFAVLKSL